MMRKIALTLAFLAIASVVVMILALAVFGLFVFSVLSSYLSERRRS